MGWSSATHLFDGAVDVALKLIPTADTSQAESVIRAVVKEMYTTIDWDDWDTQDESEYFEPYLRDVMTELGEIDPED